MKTIPDSKSIAGFARGALAKLCASSDRHDALCEIMSAAGIPFRSIRLKEARNIICNFAARRGQERFYSKVFAAHYDTHPGSPGANDNGAGVVELLLMAQHLNTQGETITGGNIICFFDREESANRGAINEMGSYLLGQGLHDRHVNSCLFFILDVCGIGDTLVVSNYLERLIAKSAAQPALAESSRVRRTLHNLRLFKSHLFHHLDERGIRHISMKTPLSDDLALVRWGYPAILLSTLPYEETLRSKTLDESPNTWRTMHSASDRPEAVQDGTLSLMLHLLQGLSKMKIGFQYEQGMP